MKRVGAGRKVKRSLLVVALTVTTLVSGFVGSAPATSEPARPSNEDTLTPVPEAPGGTSVRQEVRTLDPRVWGPSPTADGTIGPAYAGAPGFPVAGTYSGNFPDPSVSYDGNTGRYVAYATATGGVNVPVMTSSDLQNWVTRSAHGIVNAAGSWNDALPQPAPPGWPYVSDDPSFPYTVWAPSSVYMGGRWVLFYALKGSAEGRFCVMYATSDRSDGPFTNPRQFYCDDAPLGSIDPQPFVDRQGQVWITWKDEGMPGAYPSRLRALRIFMGDPYTVGIYWEPITLLLQADGGWDGGVVENPSLVDLPDGRLALLYSGGQWNSDAYATGVAVCSGLSPAPSGAPVCTRTSPSPWLNRKVGKSGIGGTTAFRGPGGQLQIIYHYWDDRRPAGYPPYPQCAAVWLGCWTQQRYAAVEPVYDLLGSLVANGEPGPSVAGSTGDLFTPTGPSRVVDSRIGLGTNVSRRLQADEVLVVDFSGRVAADVDAVTINLTVTEPTSASWVLVFPCGRPPVASNVNYVAGQSIPNQVTARLNDDKKLCIYTRGPTHLVVDHQGSWSSRTGMGWTGVAPTRVTDTRTFRTRLAPDEVIEVPVVVPGASPGASAVAVSLTSDASGWPGFLTAWGCDGPPPLASNVNYGVLDPSANGAFVPISSRGTICVTSHATSHVIVDVLGYFAPTGEGFGFSPPLRVLDTRYGGAAGVIRGGTTVELPLGASPDRSVSANLTVTEPQGAGFISVFPCANPPPFPGTSNLNYVRGDVRSGSVIVRADAAGRVCVKASATTHLVVDVVGRS